MKLIFNRLLDIWYRIAYHSFSFSALKPDSVEVGIQDPKGAVRWIPSVRVGNQSKQAFFTHPPSQLTYRLKVPPRGMFRAFVTLIPEAWGQNPGGVEFNVSVSSRSNGRSVSRKCWSHPTELPKHRRWMEFRVSLRRFANQEVDLTLSTTTPPEASADYAWAIWGNPVILSRGFLRKTWSLGTSSLRIARDFLYFVRSVYQKGYMIRSMVIRDLRTRYIGSFLGFFWTIIHPLTQLFLYYLVFSVILKIRLGPEYGGTGFAIWLIAGLLPWLFFSEIVTRSPGAVLEQAHLITKTIFPSEILPFTHLIVAMINHLIAVAVFVGFLLIFGYGISLNILLIIPILFAMSIFAMGISWVLSALNVFLRDIGQLVGVLVNIWFFLTPIMYPRHLIPENLQKFYSLNPMLHMIEAYRSALLGKTNLEIQSLPYLVIPSLIAFVLGGLIFRKLKPAFADVL